MKVTIILAAALGLITTVARAESEGNGDPFPFRVPGVVTFVAPGASSMTAAPTLPAGGHALAEAPRVRSQDHHS